jgi:hypothetical protein
MGVLAALGLADRKFQIAKLTSQNEFPSGFLSGAVGHRQNSSQRSE